MDSAFSSPSNRTSDVAHARGKTIDGKKLQSSHTSITDGSFVEGSEGVTHEELATLRHLPDSIPFTAFLVIVVEFAERWSYYGGLRVAPWTIQIPTTYALVTATSAVWGNYIRAGLPPGSTTGAVPADHRANGVAGALGRGVQAFFAISGFSIFWVYVTPFLGGWIADCYLGRYKTILYSSFVSL